MKRLEDELKTAVRALLGYIDAIPADVVLPAMPGVDRDWVESLLSAPDPQTVGSDLTGDPVNDLAHQASLGNRQALADLKQRYPRREFRRAHCDLRGTVLQCRGKGTKAPWKRL